jgi:predicted ribosome quality control (RQC) complex YloA/Tae2 family protein
MTTTLNKKLRNEIEELQEEIKRLENQIDCNQQFDEQYKNAAFKIQQELHTVKELAAELCQVTILLSNYPTLAKELKLAKTGDAINKYLRYIMNV